MLDPDYLKIRDLRQNLKSILDGQHARAIGDRWRLRGIIVPISVRVYAHGDERRVALREAEKKLKQLIALLKEED